MVDADLPGIVRVPVTAGDDVLFTLMDEADAMQLSTRSLSLSGNGYVQLWWEKQVISLHRWVLGLKKGDGRIGDHINGDRLDNRRANLRAVSPSGSSQNISGSARSGYRGVYRKPSGSWYARVEHKGHTYDLGTFPSKELAALAADAKRRELMPDYVGIRSAPVRHGSPDRRTAAERRRRRAVAAEIRAWARSQGIPVGDVGRIPVAIVASYEAQKSA